MLASCADHLDVIEYLRSQSASWEARLLEVLYSAADGGPFPITEWITNDSCKVGVISTFCREDSIVPNVKRLIFYIHVSPVVVHFWILWARLCFCLMENYLPERTMPLMWVQESEEQWKCLKSGGVDETMLIQKRTNRIISTTRGQWYLHCSGFVIRPLLFSCISLIYH